MWKRHPLIRFVLGITLALLFMAGLFIFIGLKADYWEDGRQPPILIEGTIVGRSIGQLRGGMGVVTFQTANGTLLGLEVSPRLYSQFVSGKQLRLLVSPGLTHTYTTTLLPENVYFTEGRYVPDVLFQDYQFLAVLAILLVCGVAVVMLGYGLAALVDWFLPPRRVRGAVVARIEQADFSPAGYGLLLRGWPNQPERRSLRFYLNQADFLATDGVDFAEINFTPLFRYVRQVRALASAEFPVTDLALVPNAKREVTFLRYISHWQRLLLLLSDGLIALVIFSIALIVFASTIPGWLNSTIEPSLPERYYLPFLAFCALMVSVYCSGTFWRKWRDLRAPKKITIGPVLSKWRVNGGTNDTRRQIVVADGGLQAGSEAVRKFDINNFLFEELRVGDIVEIEHTPRLRYILRLEVKGHQELSKQF